MFNFYILNMPKTKKIDLKGSEFFVFKKIMSAHLFQTDQENKQSFDNL